MATTAETAKRGSAAAAADNAPSKTGSSSGNSKTKVATAPTNPSMNPNRVEAPDAAAVVVLDYSTAATPTTTEQHLQVLTDGSSSYAAVAKAC